MIPKWSVTLDAYTAIAAISRTIDGNMNIFYPFLTAQEAIETKMLDD